MAKQPTLVEEKNLAEHAAVKAWARICPGAGVPERIYLLTKINPLKSAVYRLEGVGPLGSAVIAKWCTPATALVEHTIYNDILPRLPMPSPLYYGMLEEGDARWLFLEDLGQEKYCPTLPQHRALAARWAGIVHTEAPKVSAIKKLPQRGLSHYLGCLLEGRELVLNYLNGPHKSDKALAIVLRRILNQFDIVESHWPQLEHWRRSIPTTLAHNDFVSQNLRICTRNGSSCLLAVDWEMAGQGVAAPDLLSVDVTEYHSVIHNAWPEFDIPALQEWARYGYLFRWIAAVYWRSIGLVGTDVAKTLPLMVIYEDRLSIAIREIGWGRYGTNS